MIQGVVSGGKVVDPVTGNRYWWPDEAPVSIAPVGTEPLGEGWVEVGYTTDGLG